MRRLRPRPAVASSRNRVTLAALVLLLAGCGEAEREVAEAPPPAARGVAVEEAAVEEAAGLPAITLPEHAVKTPHPAPVGPELEAVLGLLAEVVDTEAADPDNPWAVAHGLLARGPGFMLRNGEPAVEAIFAEYAYRQELGGQQLVGFPRSRGAIRIEPHTDLLLKALTEAGVDPHRRVTAEGQPQEVGDLWAHSLLTTWLVPATGESSFDSPNDMPWGMQGLAAWAPPGLSWRAWQGTDMSMDALSRLLVHVLHTESAFMLQAMARGEDFEKRGQGIFKYTCGGAHLLQGSAFVVARGFGGEAEREKLRLQGQLLFYRFPRELDIYARAVAQHPDQELLLVAQQLKFVGHWLESAHKILASGLYTAGPAEQQVLDGALGVLVETVGRLKTLGAYDNLGTIRAQNEQLYLDLVGDSAHALRGAELATGRAEYRY